MSESSAGVTDKDAAAVFDRFYCAHAATSLNPTRDNLREVGAAITALRDVINDNEDLTFSAVEYLRIGLIFGRRPFDAAQAKEFQKSASALKSLVDAKRARQCDGEQAVRHRSSTAVVVQSAPPRYAGPPRDAAGEVLVKFTVPDQGLSRLMRMRFDETVREFIARNLDRVKPHDSTSYGLFLHPRTEYEGGRWFVLDDTVGSFDVREMDVIAYMVQPAPIRIHVKHPNSDEATVVEVHAGATAGDVLERMRSFVWADFYERNWAFFINDAYVEPSREIASIFGIGEGDKKVEVRPMPPRMRRRVDSLSAFAVVTVYVAERGMTLTTKFAKNRTIAELAMMVAKKAQLESFDLANVALRVAASGGVDVWLDMEQTVGDYVMDGVVENAFSVVFEVQNKKRPLFAKRGSLPPPSTDAGKEGFFRKSMPGLGRLMKYKRSASQDVDRTELEEEWQRLRESKEAFEREQREKTLAAAIAHDKGSFEIKLEELELDYSEEGRLGGGTYGEVWRGKFRGLDVAVKKLKFTTLGEKEIAEFSNEVAIMKSLRHPNILMFMGACAAPLELYIVSELVSGGSLYDRLHNALWTPTLGEARAAVLDVTRGVNYLHLMRPQIIHRDLKSLNVLVHADGSMKICDFGLSKLRDKTDVSLHSRQGTPKWMAPEIMREEGHDEKSDVYSLGLVMFEVVTGQLPFADLNIMQLLMQVGLNGMRPIIPESVDAQFRELIVRCWCQEPAKRPTCQEVIEHLERIQCN